MADMVEVIGQSFREFNTPGSMGVVRNVRYIRCFWPVLDDPVALFASGSNHIEVQGPPTPRNVVFPPDTIALGISVDDGNFRDGRKWRTSEILTSIDCYFTSTDEDQEVVDQKEFTVETEVEPGLFRDVKYNKGVSSTKSVRVRTNVTSAEARRIASSPPPKVSAIKDKR